MHIQNIFCNFARKIGIINRKSMKRGIYSIVFCLLSVFSLSAQKIQVGGVYFILNEEFQTAEVTFKGNFYYEFDEYQEEVNYGRYEYKGLYV